MKNLYLNKFTHVAQNQEKLGHAKRYAKVAYLVDYKNNAAAPSSYVSPRVETFGPSKFGYLRAACKLPRPQAQCAHTCSINLIF